MSGGGGGDPFLRAVLVCLANVLPRFRIGLAKENVAKEMKLQQDRHAGSGWPWDHARRGRVGAAIRKIILWVVAATGFRLEVKV